ncbi:hypothetical protein Nmel_002741 [Mimus melanotis]
MLSPFLCCYKLDEAPAATGLLQGSSTWGSLRGHLAGAPWIAFYMQKDGTVIRFSPSPSITALMRATSASHPQTSGAPGHGCVSEPPLRDRELSPVTGNHVSARPNRVPALSFASNTIAMGNPKNTISVHQLTQGCNSKL